MDPSGFSFQPGATDTSHLNLPGQARGTESPQSIVRMLSLRIPRRAAQGQIAPQALLQSQGGGGLDGVIKALMQSFGLGQGQQGGLNGQSNPPMGQMNAPQYQTPRIIPGGGGGDPQAGGFGDRSQPDPGGDVPTFPPGPGRSGFGQPYDPQGITGLF